VNSPPRLEGVGRGGPFSVTRQLTMAGGLRCRQVGDHREAAETWIGSWLLTDAQVNSGRSRRMRRPSRRDELPHFFRTTSKIFDFGSAESSGGSHTWRGVRTRPCPSGNQENVFRRRARFRGSSTRWSRLGLARTSLPSYVAAGAKRRSCDVKQNNIAGARDPQSQRACSWVG
jgi:hypothetical protein